MKKPNITPGPWRLVYEPEIYIMYRVAGPRKDNTSNFIADCNEESGSHEENLANARAIHAVPDLIHELIQARERILKEWTRGAVKDIDKALKKAGCKL